MSISAVGTTAKLTRYTNILYMTSWGINSVREKLRISKSMYHCECSARINTWSTPIYLIYENDFAINYKVLKFILFADDTNLLRSVKNIDVLITAVNIELKHYFETTFCLKYYTLSNVDY